jgi:copper oxidase (laccase) domain-containing protein
MNVYQMKEFADRCPGIVHGFSTRLLGNMSRKYAESDQDVLARRQVMCSELGVNPVDLRFMQPQQMDRIVVVGPAQEGPNSCQQPDDDKADGFLAAEKGIALCLNVADCVPILLFDPKTGVIGLAHAGWAGTSLHIAIRLIEKARRVFYCDPRDLIIAIGPSCRSTSYHRALQDLGQIDDPAWHPYLYRISDKGLIAVDLLSFNVTQIISTGVSPLNLYVSPHETGKETPFYSNFQGEHSSRFSAIIALTK